jgi:SSS family solute:Na+ symporter
VRSALALCWLLFMASNVGIMLFASARMFVTAFGLQFEAGPLAGHEITLCLLITAALVGVYTFAGGLAAVVYTDMIQCTVMIGGCLLVLVFGVVEVGGVEALVDRVHEVEQAQAAATASASAVAEHTSLILPVDTKSPFPWPAILIGLGLILSPAYWIGNQAIVQRSLGARSEFEAKAAYIWGALLKNLIPFIIAVPGLIAFVCYPNLEHADNAFPTLVALMLPVGVKGLFLAAFAAALMSSIDSYLNSAATILTKELSHRFIHPQADERRLLRVGRITTVVLLLWGIGFGLYVSRLEGSGIYAIFQTLMAFFQGPAFALLLTGLLWRRANGPGALVGFLGGVATSIVLFALNQETVCRWLGLEPLFQVEEPFLYFSIWAFLVAMTLIITVSLLTRPEPDEKIRSLLYRRSEAAP